MRNGAGAAGCSLQLVSPLPPGHPAGTPPRQPLPQRADHLPRPRPPPPAPPRSQLISQVQAGQLNAAAAVRALRALCDAVISTSWHSKQKPKAQAASDLLDEANELLADLEEGAAGGAPPAPPPEPEPAAPPPAAKPQLPPETFFLSSDAVRECLTLNIDSSILQGAQRRGGWPAGRKRKPDGGAGGTGGWAWVGNSRPAVVACCAWVCIARAAAALLAAGACGPPALPCQQHSAAPAALPAAKRKGRRQYNPWSPELQQQLATVLQLALRCGAARCEEKLLFCSSLWHAPGSAQCTDLPEPQDELRPCAALLRSGPTSPAPPAGDVAALPPVRRWPDLLKAGSTWCMRLGEGAALMLLQACAQPQLSSRCLHPGSPQALSALAGHLRGSQAGEQLVGMGASFAGAAGMLQVGPGGGDTQHGGSRRHVHRAWDAAMASSKCPGAPCIPAAPSRSRPPLQGPHLC